MTERALHQSQRHSATPLLFATTASRRRASCLLRLQVTTKLLCYDPVGPNYHLEHVTGDEEISIPFLGIGQSTVPLG